LEVSFGRECLVFGDEADSSPAVFNYVVESDFFYESSVGPETDSHLDTTGLFRCCGEFTSIVEHWRTHHSPRSRSSAKVFWVSSRPALACTEIDVTEVNE
jgi:hypothetical protein